MTWPLPLATELSYAQYAGWACCWCGTSLLGRDGMPVGRAEGRSGAHDLSIQVYACPPCAIAGPHELPPSGSDRPKPGRAARHHTLSPKE